jgi:hypothetical protein
VLTVLLNTTGITLLLTVLLKTGITLLLTVLLNNRHYSIAGGATQHNRHYSIAGGAIQQQTLACRPTEITS